MSFGNGGTPTFGAGPARGAAASLSPNGYVVNGHKSHEASGLPSGDGAHGPRGLDRHVSGDASPPPPPAPRRGSEQRVVAARPSEPTSVGLPVDGALDEAEEERARLEAEIAGARARVLAARHRAAVRDTEAKAAVRTELAAAREALADIDRRHAEALAAVRDEAASEAQRIVDEAHRRAAELDSGSTTPLVGRADD